MGRGNFCLSNSALHHKMVYISYPMFEDSVDEDGNKCYADDEGQFWYELLLEDIKECLPKSFVKTTDFRRKLHENTRQELFAHYDNELAVVYTADNEWSVAIVMMIDTVYNHYPGLATCYVERQFDKFVWRMKELGYEVRDRNGAWMSSPWTFQQSTIDYFAKRKK